MFPDPLPLNTRRPPCQRGAPGKPGGSCQLRGADHV